MWNRTMFIFLCLMLCVNGASKTKTEPSNLMSVCLSEKCTKSSEMIVLCIDEQYEPCDNFYRLACGKSIDKKKKTERIQRSTSSFHNENKRLIRLMKSYLVSEHSVDGASLGINLVKDLYKSCMDNATREKQGIQPMVEMIKRYGGWPVVEGDNWDEKKWDWLETNAKMLNDGIAVDPFFKLTTIFFKRKFFLTSMLAIKLPDGFGMAKTENLTEYYNLMVDMAVIFGANRSIARLEMTRVLWFELEIMELCNSSEELSHSYEKIAIREMHSEYPYIDWIKFIRSVVPNDVKIDDDEIILFKPSKYFVYLEIILKQTGNRTIANYLIWRSILASAPYLTKNLYKSHGHESDDDACLDYVNHFLPLELGNLYIHENAKTITNARATITEMAFNIRSEFIKMLEDAKWMKPDEKKQEALDTVSSVDFIVGYSDNSNHETEQFSKGLELNSSNFFDNVLRIGKFNQNLRFQKIHKLNDSPFNIRKSSWKEEVEYSPDDNTVYIYAGMLHWPYFVLDRPSYMNYGAIGQSIGHALAYSFNTSLEWSNDMTTVFQSKVDCFKLQYKQFYIKNGYQLDDPGLIINEDIADNIGVKAAYRAYQSLTIQKGSEPLLAGLENYTQRQLFWISMAHTICSSTEQRNARQFIRDQYRIFSMTKNMPDFAYHFKCSLKMNSKCKIW